MNIFGYTIPQVYKAIAGFFTPGIVALGVAIATDSPGGGTITPAEWIGIVLAMVVTGGLVFAVPPSPAKTTPIRSVHDELYDERGSIETGSLLVSLACLVIIVVGLVWIVRAF